MNNDIMTVDEVAQHIDNVKIQKCAEIIPTITITTNKNIYHKGDKITVDVHVVNAGDEPVQVKIQIWLQLPNGKIWIPSIIKKWDILLAGSDKTDTYDISSLPLISTGVYSWHAQMKDKLSSIISKDEIIWALRGYRWQCSKSDAACARILDDGLLAVSI